VKKILGTATVILVLIVGVFLFNYSPALLAICTSPIGLIVAILIIIIVLIAMIVFLRWCFG
jgi:hypothetical protein